MSTDSTPNRILHVVGGYEGFHLVSPATLAAASIAQAEADAIAPFACFGDVRRAANVALLSDSLESWDISVEDYVAAIERAAGRSPATEEITERLLALVDVDFDGDDDANAPGDSSDFLSESQREAMVEDAYTHTFETGMLDDVPDDILDEYCVIQSPMFSDADIAFVENDRLEEAINALEAQGFTVVREGES